MTQDLKPRELIEGFIDSTLDEDRLSELKQLLGTDPSLRSSMAMELRLRGLLRARKNDSSGLGDDVTRATHDFSPKSHEDGIMDIINSKANPPLPFKPAPKTSHRFARAAAWFAAFTWFGNKAQAAGTTTTTTGSLLTAKTVGTVSLVLLGGGSLYLIHHKNQETTARIEQLQIRKDSLVEATAESQAARAQIKATTRETTPQPADPNIVYLDKLSESLGNLGDMREWRIATEGMDDLDLEALKQLLIDAQENPLHSRSLPAILEKMGERFPADATVLAAKVLASYSPFHTGVSNQLGNNFGLWLKANRKAADQWYFAAIASGELMPKSIPGPEEEPYMPGRILAKHRFQALFESDPEQVVSMVGAMREDDVAHVLNHWQMDAKIEDTNTEFLSRIISQLSPERQDEALQGHVFSMAFRDFTKASEWLDRVVVSEEVHAKLLIHATRVAYGRENLSQSEALKVLEGLPESPEREDARRKIESK